MGRFLSSVPPRRAAASVTPADSARLRARWTALPGALYLYAALRLPRRGDAWPVLRTVSCLLGGLGTVAVALLSGLAAYDTRLFGVHMVQHMILAMVSPVFLALGAPVTLALRTLPSRPRGALLALLHSRLAKVLTFPAIPWLLFIGSPFALYFSGWYAATLEHPVLHDLLTMHGQVAGGRFYLTIIGHGAGPGRGRAGAST